MEESVTSIQAAFGPVLKPLAWVYGVGMRLREGLYKRGLFRTWQPAALTVSVGNIGWGGTGKTPIAGWLLDWAQHKGIEALLLTRGYKAKPVKYPYLVQSGALVEEAGDEPLMLATSHPRAHVIVDPNRIRGGQWGVKQFNPKLVVLDDGFQHMAVERHVNLVLLKPADLASQWNMVIPAGSWRESMSALDRADAFMIKVGPTNFAKLKPYFKERLERFHKPIFSFQVQPTGIRQVLRGNTERDFDGGSYLLVTGVGDPELVKRTATSYFGYKPMKHLVYRDHHFYTKSDVLEMQTVARKFGCEAILCTPKDAVKLGPMCTEMFWQFDLRVDFGPSSIGENTPFTTWWNRRYDTFSLHPGTQSAEHADPQGTSAKDPDND